jgi:hypothetical protein
MRKSLPRFCLVLIATMGTISLFAQPIPSNALSFDGTDDYVLTTAQGASGNSARTVEAWVKTTANCVPGAGGGVQQTIVDWGVFATSSRFTFNLLWANAPRLEVGGNGLSGVTAVNDGYWHHVAVVYDPNATNNYKIYVDGSLDAQGNLTVSTNTSSGTYIQIGKRVDGNNPFTGEIDEVRIWNSARTSAQIAANYNKELCSPPITLVAYYKANQGVAAGNNSTVLTLNDAVANQHGTLYNFGLTGSSSNWVAGAPLPGGKDTTLSASACVSFTDPLGTTYTSSGTYTYAYPMSNGCDSTIHLQLTIDTVNTGVTQSGTMQTMNLLTANASNAAYQWIDCGNGNAAISGATSQLYTATANGSYAVVVTQNGCTDTSSCYTVAGIGVREVAPADIKLMPNPSKGSFTVDLGQVAPKANVEIWDVMGRRVLQKSAEGVQRIPVQTKLSPGVYLVKVQANGQSVTRRMVIE